MKASPALLFLLIAATAALSSASSAVPSAGPVAPSGTDLERRLVEFLDRAFDEAAALNPETLTALGSKEQYGRLNDYTDAADHRALALRERQLAAMRAQFDIRQLGPEGRLNYQLFEYAVSTERRQFRWRWHRFPVSTNRTPAGTLPAFLINQHRIDSVDDARAYVSRLREVERVMREIADHIRRQADMGIIPPRMVFDPARADANRVITGAPFDASSDSILLLDFKRKVAALDVPDTVKAELVAEARAALAGPFKRGYDSFIAALDSLEPRATANHGAWSLPEGAAYYDSRLEFNTTTGLTADQIHRIGLTQVANIHVEIERIKRRVGFDGTIRQFFDHIRTDARFKYPDTAAGREQYLVDARRHIAELLAAAPAYFHRLPQARLEVRAVEQWRQETAAVAFYEPPAPDGSRPGIYYVNLADMNQVLRPQVEAIAYHEGAPGHHFQIARAIELTGVPKFRRLGYYAAYGEGWGLYSERLAAEMGRYGDPYSELGMLSLQLWRAIRLVVDTGLHAKRWSREQAIDYFRVNSPMSERDIVKEVNRYINNPGQATSYMIGQLRITELRDRARAALGDRFDLRDFHEAVLAHGSLPLDLLEQQVDAYIADSLTRGG